MRHLQELYTQCKDKGLVVLGFNSSDDKKIALDFLAENGATFPTILDSSDAALKATVQDYRTSGVPVNYVIDREGKVVDAWYGYEAGHPRARAALQKVGIQAAVQQPLPSPGAGEGPGVGGRRSQDPKAVPEGGQAGQPSPATIALTLNAPSLVPPAVQLTFLDKDHVPAFKAHVKMMQAYYRRQLESAPDDAKKELVRSSGMLVSWDFGFREVTGDRLHLLTARGTGEPALFMGALAGKRWIVTKTVFIKDKPVCWCIPVEVKPGEQLNVTLNEANMFDLRSAFDEAMRESGQTN